MHRQGHKTTKVMLSLTAAIAASASMAAGCGWLSSRPSAERSPSPAASSPASTGAASATPSSPAATVRYRLPANPCAVVTAGARARLRMTKAKSDSAAFQKSCKLSNTPESSPPRHFLFLRLTFDDAPKAISDATAYARTVFARRMASDFRQPNAFAGPPSVRGTIRQVGNSKAGQDYDEGYYVFYKTTVAGSKEGNGQAVIRKGNVVVTITASGNTIPGRRVVDSRPIGNTETQRMIDTIADHVLQAVTPAS